MMMSRVIFCLLFIVFFEATYAEENRSIGLSIMASGSRLIESATQLRAEASQIIQQSHQLRQTVQQNRKLGTPKTVLNQQIEDGKALQRLGSRLRKQSQTFSDEAVDLLEQGLTIEYQKWVESTGAVTLSTNIGKAGGVGEPRAHNVIKRSHHPKMEKLMPMPNTHQPADMTMSLTSMAPQKLPEPLDLSPFQLSRDRVYFAYVGVEPVQLNTLQSWRLILTTLKGEPIENASIRFDGIMPGHVHGLPTQPRVTKEIAPGVYRISGVKFQMRGWWVIDLVIEPNVPHPKKRDILRFNLVL